MSARLPFELRRGAAGVPWVVADDERAVAFGQGWATAVDRCWQLTCDRWHARGETAEHLGPGGAEWDGFATETDLMGTARRAWDALDPMTRSWIGAYADGVTRGFADLESGAAGRSMPAELARLGARPPERWEPVDSLAVFWLQQVLLGSWGHELWRAHVTDVARRDPVVAACQDVLVGRPTRTAGSNAVGIAGALTAGGRPVVVADPHRLLEIPGGYQQIGLVCRGDDGFDAVGLAFPGVPGIPHFGHNGRVAWAVTHAMALGEVPDATGALVSAADLATRGDSPLGLGLDVMRSLLHARTVDDAGEALRRWVAPVDAWLLADETHLVEGVAGSRLRPGADPGSGPRVEQVHRLARVDAVAVHANDARALTADLGPAAPPHRAQRLRELVEGLLAEGPGVVTARAVARLLTDTRLDPDALVPQLAEGPLVMAADDPQAGAYAARRDALARRLAATSLASLAGPSAPTADVRARYPHLVQPWLDPADRVAHALPRLAREHPRLVAEEAARVVREHPARPLGLSHRPAPVHALGPSHLARHGVSTRPTGGDAECVCSTTTTPSSEGAYARGPVARVAWDLSDRGAGGWVVPFGAAGDLHDPHAMDQHDIWARGELLPLDAPAAAQDDP